MAQDDLTLKQRKWLKLYLELGNATEAAAQVYDCGDRDSARQIGWENLTKLDFSDFLEEAGITDKLLQEKIMEGLDSTRTVSAVNTSKNATASSTDFVDVPDFMARHKYLETALKLKRKLVERTDVTSGGKPIPILTNNALSTDQCNKETPTTE